jgi:hypothetical protein
MPSSIKVNTFSLSLFSFSEEEEEEEEEEEGTLRRDNLWCKLCCCTSFTATNQSRANVNAHVLASLCLVTF